jgi:hypothetical protein
MNTVLLLDMSENWLRKTLKAFSHVKLNDYITYTWKQKKEKSLKHGYSLHSL